MAWSYRVEYKGEVFDVDSGSYGYFDGARICLTKKMIDDLGESGIYTLIEFAKSGGLGKFAKEKWDEENSSLPNFIHTPKQPKKKERGFVYLIESGGAYKIGKSKSLTSRAYQFAATMPHRVTLIHSIESDNYGDIETELHEHFQDKRLNGEWFALSSDDVEYIKAITE